MDLPNWLKKKAAKDFLNYYLSPTLKEFMSKPDINPMSAEECWDTIDPDDFIFQDLQGILAAHTARLMGKMPTKHAPEPNKHAMPFSNANTHSRGYNDALSDCLSILQKEIDELTK